MAVTGMSLPGLPTDLPPEAVQGPERELELGVGNSQRPLLLPSSMAVWLAGTPPVEVATPGVSGVCDASLEGAEDPESMIRSGMATPLRSSRRC